MKLKHLFTLIFTLIVLILNAQSIDEEVLFTIADEPVYAVYHRRAKRKIICQ